MSPNGDIKSIQVHDLLHEVALGEAKRIDFLLIWKEENAEMDVSMTRRVVFQEGIDATSSINHPKDLTKINMPNLRIFLNFDRRDVIGIGFLLLRVLELRNTQSFKELPPYLKNVIHLRYLGLRGTVITVIPTWIDNLQNLQTLDIRGAVIMKFPEHFWKIKSIRHVHSTCLNATEGHGTPNAPPPTANLINLRSLGCLMVPESWKKGLPHIPGIRKLQLNCRHDGDGMLVHGLLSKSNNLLSVRLDSFNPPEGIIDFSITPSYQNIHTMYVSGAEYIDLRRTRRVQINKLPPNLIKLKLSSIFLYNDPMPILEELRSLKWLELNEVRIEAETETMVCSCGGFPQLQTLKLDYVPTIMEWKVEYGALPVLKYLLIKSCNLLRALPDLRRVTTLQELRVSRELLSGEEWHKVEHIPIIM
jgi:disease resistance protein RPM1